MSNTINNDSQRVKFVSVINPPLELEHTNKAHTHTGIKWSIANSKVGEKTSNYLNISVICDVLKNYFNSFIQDGSNIFATAATNVFGALGDFFLGARDKDMYEEVYATGVKYGEDKLNMDLLQDPQSLISELPIADDMEEDRTRFNDDSVIRKLWLWSTQSSGLKPYVYPFFGLIGGRFASLGKLALDMMPKLLWRTRFLNSGLYSTASKDLFELGTSMFRGESRRKKISELSALAQTYFCNKHPLDKEKYSKKTGIGLYLSMLYDMQLQHFKDAKDPQNALQKKCASGYLTEITNEEREKDPSKQFSYGFVNPSSKADQHFQRIASMADLVGPLFGSIGIGITMVIDPLKAVMEGFKIETGRRWVDAVASSKKGLSMVYYFFKFMLRELTQSNCDKLKDTINNGDPTKATRLLYEVRKSRNYNAWSMIITGLANVIEPYLHLKTSENRGYKFFSGLISDIGNSFFLRGFSKRRECLGKLRYLYSVAADILKKPSADHINEKDFENITDEMLEKGLSKFSQENIEEDREPTIKDKLNNKMNRFWNSLGSEATTDDIFHVGLAV